jgi:ABC-type transport system involved in cytochrome bd biosynthesis fused ATPase/permease subunit
MEYGNSSDGGRRSPLQRAKAHESVATYSIGIVVAFVAVLIVRAVMVSSAEPAGDQQRLMSAVVTLVQFIVTLAALALIRNQISIAVRQIEQSAESEVRLVALTEAIHALAAAAPPRPVPPPARTVRGAYRADDRVAVGAVSGVRP